MSSKNARPKWWQVYLTLPLLVALFVVDSRLKISSRGHQVVQIGIILIIYGLMYLWVRVNSSSLRAMDQSQDRPIIRVFRIPPDDLRGTGSVDNEHVVPQLPSSEIKGVLSDTFEMDYLDAESLPVDEVPQE